MTSGYCFYPADNHQLDNHPEHPSRFSLIELPADDEIVSIPFTKARINEVKRVHTDKILERLEQAALSGGGIIDSAPTYVTPASYEDALTAAGAALAATRAVVKGTHENSFAIIRPPGHHAEPGRSMGFCLLNNAAIACLDAIESGVERAAIVDIDAHHGNGTEQCFLNNPRAAYFSTHQENIYPGSGGMFSIPHAKGRIGNFPLAEYSGDICFDQIIQQALTPFLDTFRPGLILVSIGFDAHHSDPLTSLGLSTRGYFSICRQLVNLAMELCDGKIVFILEGGYLPKNAANGVKAVFNAMTGKEMDPVDDLSKFKEPDINSRINAFRTWDGL
ncbi:MAG: histone deacetylase [Chloroflexota bacterium]